MPLKLAGTTLFCRIPPPLITSVTMLSTIIYRQGTSQKWMCVVSEMNAYLLDVLGFQYNAAVWIGSFLCHNYVHIPKVNYKITENNPPKWFTSCMKPCRHLLNCGHTLRWQVHSFPLVGQALMHIWNLSYMQEKIRSSWWHMWMLPLQTIVTSCNYLTPTLIRSSSSTNRYWYRTQQLGLQFSMQIYIHQKQILSLPRLVGSVFLPNS